MTNTLYRAVSVSEGLPEKMKWVTIIHEDGNQFIARINEYNHWNYRDVSGTNTPNDNIPVTHWLEPVNTDADVSDSAIEEMVSSFYSSDPTQDKPLREGSRKAAKRIRDLMQAKMEAMRSEIAQLKDEKKKLQLKILRTENYNHQLPPGSEL